MFHFLKVERVKFKSNPPLSPIPHVIRDINEFGDPINKCVLVNRDNKSPFAGSHYDPEKHSLRAMLNLGIQLTSVNYDIINNDLNSMYQMVKHESESLIHSSSARLAAAAAVTSEPIVEPSKESSNEFSK